MTLILGKVCVFADSAETNMTLILGKVCVFADSAETNMTLILGKVCVPMSQELAVDCVCSVWLHIACLRFQFEMDGSPGVVLCMCSAILSRGIDR